MPHFCTDTCRPPAPLDLGASAVLKSSNESAFIRGGSEFLCVLCGEGQKTNMARASHPGHIVCVKHPEARRRGRHRTEALSASNQVSPARLRAQVYAALPAFAADAGGFVLVRGLPAHGPLGQLFSPVAGTSGAATPGSESNPPAIQPSWNRREPLAVCDALAQRSGHLTSALPALCLTPPAASIAKAFLFVQNLWVCSFCCGRLRKNQNHRP